jgi:predicted Ser/Thr protein kinase
MIGKTLGHYQITEKLGEGGMGVVYKARDLHLDRFVALKILPPEKVADAERKRRFVQEAKAASALNHPNIVTIHDITQEGGTDFIVMEYVEGKTLDQRIGHRGLRLNDALKYAVQIADALAKAHSAGIVHRDLKPTNIMVNEDGVVKVLDFGLAKLTEQVRGDETASTATIDSEGRPITEEGVIVGTVAYMSPEQALGETLDARSDIFSFGSVLYEMVAGRRAFSAESPASTRTLILLDDPPPLARYANDVPTELQRIVSKALRKDRRERYQTIRDLGLDLKFLAEQRKLGISREGTEPQETVEERYLEAAIPQQVVVGEVAELLVMIRLGDSPGLKGLLAGAFEFQARPEDVKSKGFAVEFPLDQRGNVHPLDFWIDIETTDFTLPVKRKKVKLHAGKDTDAVVFLLTPLRRGELRLIVQAYADEETLLASGLLRVQGATKLDESLKPLKVLITLSLGVFGVGKGKRKDDLIAAILSQSQDAVSGDHFSDSGVFYSKRTKVDQSAQSRRRLGRWVLETKLGSGGMGDVYLGRESSDEMTCIPYRPSRKRWRKTNLALVVGGILLLMGAIALFLLLRR